MVKNQQPRICANCKHWKRHDVDYGDFPEDECGYCGNRNSDYYGETMYGDDEACDEFSASKKSRRR